MAKVSKKQLGRRRRTALLLLLALIAAAVYLLFFRSDSSRNVPTKETTAVLQSTAMTETTTTEEIGVLYQGTIPVQTELTVPTEPAVLTASQVELDAQPVLQNPELPTGCEVTTLTAALNYLGYPVDKLTMADQYLTRAEPYQATFGEAFIGSPHDANAWGCYAPVIVETAQKYLDEQGNGEVAQNLTGCSLKTLLWEVANGNPVITWVTINLTSRVEERYYWTTPKGEDAVFLINEHCVLLCGYDLNANTVTVCDPLEGKIQYDMDKFENRYQLVYQQAVVLRKPESLTGTEITFAHVMGGPAPVIYQKLGLNPQVDYRSSAIGIMNMTPPESAVIASDIAVKSGNVYLGFADRFTGTLIITGEISDVMSAMTEVVDYFRDTLGYVVCKITKR